jgi:hypothetical protein
MLKRTLQEESAVKGAVCPVTPSPQQANNRGLAWVFGTFLICPCHLPLTIALASTVLAGTTAGVLLRAHPLAAGTVITAAWVAGTWRGIHHLRAAQRSAASSTETRPRPV